jgi:hypothetical protein
MDDQAAVVLNGVFKTKRLTLSFLWNTRRFALCADRTLRRYDGEQLRHSAAITSTTSVAKVGDADFTVTFLQPDLRYHIRAASSAERDRWVAALAEIASNTSAAAQPAPASATAATTAVADKSEARSVIFSMGFDEALVQRALTRTGGDEQAAIEILISRQLPLDESPSLPSSSDAAPPTVIFSMGFDDALVRRALASAGGRRLPAALPQALHADRMRAPAPVPRVRG